MGLDPSQQHIGETPIPALMGEPMGGGIIPPAAEPGVFGPMGVQPMLQQQEVLVPAPPQQQQQQQQQGMLVPSPLLGPRSAVPQLVSWMCLFSFFYVHSLVYLMGKMRLE